MKNSFEVSDVIRVKPDVLEKAWLDSKEHGKFTGSKANIDPKVGGKFIAGDGYIFGETLEIKKDIIIQAWRTTEFATDAKDSKLVVVFEKHKDGTKLTFKHSALPGDQVDDYKQGWTDFYFTPMKEYYKK